MKKLIILFSLLSFTMKSQMAINHQWSFNPKNTVPQGANVDNRGIVSDAGGNIYVTGYFSNTADFDPSASISYLQSNGGSDVYLAKYSPSGTLIWANKIGGGSGDQATDIAIDASSNIYITGSFIGTVDFDPSAAIQNRTSNGTNPDIFVAKYDANGNFVFASVTGGTLTDGAYGIAVSSTNVYVTGSFYGTSDFDPSAAVATLTAVPGGSTDAYIWKLDLAGNYVGAINWGGTLSEVGNGIKVDASNNVYVTGSYMSTCDFDPSAATQTLTTAGSTDIYVAKYNSTLAYSYAISMGGTGADVGNGITVDASGNTFVTGNFNGTADFDPSAATATIISAGSGDIFYAKYNSTGNYVYANGIGGTMSDFGRKITADAAGNVYLTGQFYATVDFDPSAATQTLLATAGSDIYLAKYDAAGSYVFAYGFGDIGTDVGYGIALDASNNIYLSGNYGATVDFDPSAAINSITAPVYTNVFFAKYNNSVTYQLAKSIGDVGGSGISETPQGITRDASGNILVTGYFAGVVDFDPSAATQTLASIGSNDIFLAKYNAAGNYLWAKSMGGTLSDIALGIKTDGANNIYLTGYFGSTDCDFDPSASTQSLATNGGNDVFIAKYDLNGNYIFATSFGSTGDDRGQSITVDGSGNIYIGGIITATVDFDPSAATATLASAGSTDGYFAKYTSAGAYIVAGLVGGTSSDQVTGIEVDASGNMIIGGYYNLTADFDPSAATQNITAINSQDAFFAKYTNAGIYVFAKSIGGTGGDLCNDMTIDAAGNIYMAGYFSNTNADFDPSAAIVNMSNQGGTDVYFAKYDANGNYIFSKAISGSGSEFVNNIITDGSNNIYLTGSMPSITDFDPSTTATLSLVTNGGTDSYLAKYDANGNLVFAKNVGGASVDVGYGIATDGTGAIYFTGTFNSVVDFDLLSNVANLTASNSQDIFIAKYTECTAVTTTVNSQINVLCNSQSTGSSTVTASGGSGFTYTWMPTGGNSTVAVNLVANTYSFIAVNSCGSSNTQTLSITEPPALTLTAVANNTVVCAPNSSTLSSSATGGTGVITYSWTNIGNSSVTVVSPASTTAYTINVTDGNNCTASAIVNVSVTPGPTVTVISSNSAFCPGGTTTLTASGANTYSWSTTSTNTTIVNSPTTTTSYTVTGTDINSCSSSTAITVTVYSNPTITAVSSQSVLCTGQTASLTAGGANSYTWNTNSNNTSIVVSPSANTTYTVNGTNANGCSGTATITQIVSACTGINPIAANEQTVSVFPNPTTGYFTLNVNNYSESLKVTIYNSIGQLVLTQKIDALRTEINVTELNAGIYFIRIEENGVETPHVKLIKN